MYPAFVSLTGFPDTQQFRRIYTDQMPSQRAMPPFRIRLEDQVQVLLLSANQLVARVPDSGREHDCL